MATDTHGWPRGLEGVRTWEPAGPLAQASMDVVLYRMGAGASRDVYGSLGS